MSPENIKVCVRVPKEIFELLTTVSSARGEGRSAFIRRAILKELASLGFLSVEQKKSLGIAEEQ